ncbi:MAG: tetratricopeptide repeat protein, partial [Patescibacteria group bacterium]
LGALYSRLTAPDATTQAQLINKALEAFNNALKLSPKKQQIYFELADVYLKKGDYQNAILVSKEAYDLDPSFNNAQMNLVAAYILNNQQNEADAILLKHRGTVDINDNLLVQVYSRLVDSYRQKNDVVRAEYYGDRLIRVWQAFIAKDPNNIEHRKRLVIVYLVLGKQAEAQRVLNEAVTEHPEFKPDLEVFVKEIQSGSLKQ